MQPELKLTVTMLLAAVCLRGGNLFAQGDGGPNVPPPGEPGVGEVSGDMLAQIHGHGHTVRYSSKLAANQWLGGRTWPLAGGGTLSPQPTQDQ